MSYSPRGDFLDELRTGDHDSILRRSTSKTVSGLLIAVRKRSRLFFTMLPSSDTLRRLSMASNVTPDLPAVVGAAQLMIEWKVTDSWQAVEPIIVFQNKDEFIRRHETATVIEMANEEMLLKRYNKASQEFDAWPVAPLSHCTAFIRSWHMLVRVSKETLESTLFPMIGDHFHISMASPVKMRDQIFTLDHLAATRVANTHGFTCDGLRDMVALQVDVPRSWKLEDGTQQELDLMSSLSLSSTLGDFIPSMLTEEATAKIVLALNVNTRTSEAELEALRHLTEQKRTESRKPSKSSLVAFEAIMNFEDPIGHPVDLRHEFPHIADPLADPYARPARGLLRAHQALAERFRNFNENHRNAFEGLFNVPPHRLYFLNGCPGAGKTEWIMVVSAMIQSRRRPHESKKRSPVLFLVDINKTVDDAADRYFKLCREVGLKHVRVIRMHGWPYELRNSPQLNRTSSRRVGSPGEESDFTKIFLDTAGLSKDVNAKRDADKAPTLDEAAWEYYHQHGRAFESLRKCLLKLDTGLALSSDDWQSLRNEVTKLYRAVLRQTDFIATTPIAASGNFSRLFRPDIVFIDEAPHARELTTLIPIAYFDPLVWILAGDVHQTRPFVKSRHDPRDVEAGVRFNPYVRQLELSTMARAHLAKAVKHQLLVNKRAFGNLHRLPSALFYGGLMVSSYDACSQYPGPASYVKRFMERLIAGAPLNENRLIVRLHDSQEKNEHCSFWNPSNSQWVLRQACNLLADPAFRSISTVDSPGTIMVQAPYRTAIRAYEAAIEKWPRAWRSRVEILTTDKAQGNQADVVFLDMVRTEAAGFMDDPKRLNVALTRARQGEIIVMHERMRWRRPGVTKTKNLSRLWDDATAAQRLWTISSQS